MSEAGPAIHQCACDVCKGGGDAATVRYHQQISLFLSRLNEPQRRWYVGVISQAADSPSDRQLALITGLDERPSNAADTSWRTTWPTHPPRNSAMRAADDHAPKKRPRARSDTAGAG